MLKAIHRFVRILIVFSVSIFVLAAFLVTWYVYGMHLSSRTLPASYAFWMDHAFGAGQTSREALDEKLKNHPIDELYFHIGPLTKEGQLANDLSLSSLNLDTLPTTNYAWIGQVRSSINLDDESIRQNIVSSAQWAVNQGFDGIHLDIEPVRGNDAAFISLLQELRIALPEAKLSVAMDEWQPSLLSRLVAGVFDIPVESYWSTDLVHKVTPHVDELVVMTYDTGFHDPNLYEWWVEQQTIALSQIVPDSVTVRIGIPAYSKGLAFDPSAENIQTGLAGYQRGVQNIRSKVSRLSGLAIYSYWEMDDGEWQFLPSL